MDWFGEDLTIDTLSRSFAAAQACGMLLTIGTSGIVQPATITPLLLVGGHQCGQDRSRQHPTGYRLHLVAAMSGRSGFAEVGEAGAYLRGIGWDLSPALQNERHTYYATPPENHDPTKDAYRLEIGAS